MSVKGMGCVENSHTTINDMLKSTCTFYEELSYGSAVGVQIAHSLQKSLVIPHQHQNQTIQDLTNYTNADTA